MTISKQYSAETGSTKSQIGDKAAEQFDKVAGHVEGAANTIAARGREVGEDVQAVAGNIKSAVDTSVRDQPMATLAVAAVFGFVMGALWKS